MWVHTAGWDHASCGSPTRHHIVAMDLTDIWTLLIVGCTALLAAVLAVVYLYLARQKEARWRQLAAVSEVARDWRTTWKINAVADPAVMEHEKDDIPSNFMLRIEENRIMRDIGGGEMIETRWRLPTKVFLPSELSALSEVQPTSITGVPGLPENTALRRPSRSDYDQASSYADAGLQWSTGLQPAHRLDQL
jgi:hypothetical protein